MFGYLSDSIPPIPFKAKKYPHDFEVEEIPAYLPGGNGEHLYLWIEKQGISSMELVRRLCRYLKISRDQVGLAGLKDARGVTRQWISFQGVREDSVKDHGIPECRILETGFHTNKLKMGHLKGNRFSLKIRDFPQERNQDLESILKLIQKRGIPNYFGHQRFGMREDTWKIGRALMREEYQQAVDIIAGSPEPEDSGRILEARTLFDQKSYQEAARAWPEGFELCARLCRSMAREKGNARRALFAIDPKMLGFYFNAFQSWLFNEVLNRRLSDFDRLEEGDLAYKHDSGAVFGVENLATEQVRCENFEISPSGPVFGRKMSRPVGVPMEIEESVLADYDVKWSDLNAKYIRKHTGGRRPLRIPFKDSESRLGQDENGSYFELKFSLPPGVYASSVLREFGKEKTVYSHR